MADRLGAFYDANVWMCQFVDGNTFYGAPVVRRTSTQGERTTTVPSGGVTFTGVPVTGDLEVIVKFTPVTSWTTAQNMVSKWVTGQLGFIFALTSAGKLQLLWTPDNSTNINKISTVAVPFTGTNAGWVRATLDVDNGASGNDLKFYTSTDGITWTQLGTTVTTAGVTSIYPATVAYQLWAGTYSWVSVRDAQLYGNDVVPNLPERWTSTSPNPPTPNGGPLVLLMNGAVAAKDIVWADDPTRLPKLLTGLNADVILTGMGINSSDPDFRIFAERYLTWVKHMKNYRPMVPIIATSQNPVLVGTGYTTVGAVQRIYERHAAIPTALANEAGVSFLDTYPAYGSSPAGLLQADSVHPTDAGHQAQADFVMRRLAPKTML